MLVNLRNTMMAGKRLPYDAEVEYLESTGTQWIDTGILANDSIVLNCDFQLTSLTPINQLNGTYNKNGRLQFGIVDGKWSIGIGSVGVGASVADTARHNVTITVPQKQVLFDGANYGSYSSASLVYDSWQRLLLFARTNTPQGIVTADQPCKERIFHCSITNYGVLVRDFIPVRKGTVGYLYDRVTRKLFGNAGTGDFVLGPDVVPVEYIESHGTEWISMPARMLPTDSCDAMVGVTTTTTNQGFLFGARKREGTGWLYSGFRRLASSLTSNAQWAKSRGSYNMILGDLSSSLQPFHWEFNYVSLGGVRDEATLANAIDLELNWALFAVTSVTGVYGAINGGRIGSFSITRNGAKIINFRPVRVGSGSTWEGAMMDVLTRRVYRNAGTGAFTYGNDLRYPIPSE